MDMGQVHCVHRMHSTQVPRGRRHLDWQWRVLSICVRLAVASGRACSFVKRRELNVNKKNISFIYHKFRDKV